MALLERRLLGSPLRGAGRRAVAAGLVAPFEVLGRTLAYGPKGGVDRDHEGP